MARKKISRKEVRLKEDADLQTKAQRAADERVAAAMSGDFASDGARNLAADRAFRSTAYSVLDDGCPHCGMPPHYTSVHDCVDAVKKTLAYTRDEGREMRPICPAQECQELLGALSDHVSMLRERSARGDDDAESVLTTIKDTLYTELMTVRGLENGSDGCV